MQEKDILLKGICCLMLLQVNGDAKGETQIRASQKDTTYLTKGLPFGEFSHSFTKTAFPIKSESEVFVPSSSKAMGLQEKSFPVRLSLKERKLRIGGPFIQRKMNMYSKGKNKNTNTVKSTKGVQKTKSTSFQWTRIATQRSGKAQLNRSIANRSCNER